MKGLLPPMDILPSVVAIQYCLHRLAHHLSLADRDPSEQCDLIGTKDAEMIADEHRYLVAILHFELATVAVDAGLLPCCLAWSAFAL